MSVKADQASAFAGQSISATVTISGGLAPYSVKATLTNGDGSTAENETVLETAGSTSISATAIYGTATFTVSVTDALNNTASDSAQSRIATYDRESAAKWESTFENVELTGDWREDVLAIARTQKGYHESTRDFVIDAEGNMKGYTRYGDWYGVEHEDWCAMFVAFCLNYANVSRSVYPWDASCERFRDNVRSFGAYVSAGDYDPQPGDLIFFEDDEYRNQAGHIGIVEDVSDTTVYTIEGNSASEVRCKSYSLNDSNIMGYSNTTALMIKAGVLTVEPEETEEPEKTEAPVETETPVVTEAPTATPAPVINEGGTVLTTPTPVPATGEKKLYESTQQATLSGIATAVQSVTLPQFGMVELSASGSGSAQWQIQVPGTQIWVNIAGETSSTIALTYAKISSMLSGGAANLRCAFGSTYSATARVTVSYGAAETEAEAEVEAPAVQAFTTFALQRPSSSVSTYNSDDETPSDDDTQTTPSTCNVVINYHFENNEMVAEPYTASLAAGTSFSTTVTFPTVQGYLPYLNEVQQNSIDLNYAAIDKDYTFNVVYKPTNVNYTVIHYKQNLDNDNYTEAERETKQGLTNSTVPEVAHVRTDSNGNTITDNGYEGFYALLYEKPAIAADGSTIVEVYYDRYYYLMNFELDGGYGVEPIYARYGAPIGEVGTPTKAGYSFKGWSLDGTNIVDKLPSTMPAENRTYKAVWQADATAKVTVVFWGENADDEEYSYIKSATVNVKPGTEFTYNESGSLVCGQEVHTHDASCGYACGQSEHSHRANCYTLTCIQEQHVHDRNCCTLEEHKHGLRCLWGALCNKEEHTHGDGNCICPKNEHSHTDYTGSCYTLTCTTPVHTHTDKCGYNCGKTAHTHTSYCYMSGAGLDSNLWKFVRSETVTVAADGSSVVNVYYDRTEFTLTFKDGNKTVYTIKEKWGADISEHWPIKGTNGTTYNNGERWSPSGSKTYTKVLVYLSIMPAESFTLTVSRVNYDTFIMHYMVETLPGETGTNYNGKTFKESFKVTANYNYVTKAEDFFDLDGFTQWASNPSFKNGQIDIDGGGDVYFYYTRNSYTLTFNDGYNVVKSESVKYQTPLSTYNNFVPAVPSAYEPGSVTFGGWYLNPECSGEEYKLDKNTMPADNVLLYAKWVSVKHTVEFYLDADALAAGTELREAITVPHGSKADPTPADPTNGSYTFVGWFYMENGVEKAFDFANMPVKKDLQVYGKWSSNVLKQYTIYYKIQGTDTEIAAPTTGSGLAGITKTFDAKGGTELNADYQEGYFPVTKSHSLTLDINATETNNTNVFTFWYVQKDAVPYTVYYVTDDPDADKTLGTIERNGIVYTIVAETKKVDENRKAVVTETFKPVNGMMPDAYQKRLVVSAEEGAVNEIIFYYTEDTTHAYYKITHYTELSTDAQGNTAWTEYASSQAVGDIGTTYSADPMTIPGFTYDEKVVGTVKSGELTANGLELKLYYTRNSYPYQVRYLEKDTGKQLADPKNDTGKYGQVISESAKNIDNYTVVTPTPQTLNIKIEESQTEAKLNIITFYYTENEATINYQVVGPTGCGTVTPTSETLKVLSGTAQGSTAAVSSNLYRFVGWYTDEACTQSVDASWVDANNKLTPQKQGADENTGYEGAYVAATYYAKFEYNLTTLTITKSGLDKYAYSGSGDQECAIITVSIKDTETNETEVYKFALSTDNPSVTIKDVKVGSIYTVSEDNNWTWRYSNGTITGGTTVNENRVIDKDADNNSVTIKNSGENPYWLGGDNYKVNVFN